MNNVGNATLRLLLMNGFASIMLDCMSQQDVAETTEVLFCGFSLTLWMQVPHTQSSDLAPDLK